MQQSSLAPQIVNEHPPRENLVDEREWLAQLSLKFCSRPTKTVLQRVSHLGPLRVQKPFYPESDGTCHVYLLHPPGGMVVGDRLDIWAELEDGCEVLLTTPSAGKIYGARHLKEKQQQTVRLSVAENACLEWLPQETIVFSGANGHLRTRVDLSENGKFFVWDIVRLGRVASGENFVAGQCRQSLEIWRGPKPLLIERNVFEAGSESMQASWGVQSANTVATLCASVSVERDTIDSWLNHLHTSRRMLDKKECVGESTSESVWGLTQKTPQVFVARYLGKDILECRKGFEFLWRQCRPLLKNTEAVTPRIWRT